MSEEGWFVFWDVAILLWATGPWVGALLGGWMGVTYPWVTLWIILMTLQVMNAPTKSLDK